MTIHLRYFLSLILLSWLAPASMAQAPASAITPEIEALLTELDSLLVRSPAINEAKEHRMASLARAYAKTNDPERRYWQAADLYDEYAAYDSDSAMAYASRAREIALELKRPDLVHDMELNMAYVLSATGLLDDAYRLLSSIDVASLSPLQRSKYYERMVFLSSHRDQYIGDHGRDTAYPAEIDSMLQNALKEVQPSDPHYFWLTGWLNFKDRDHAREAIKEVQPHIDSCGFTTRDDAMSAWMLSKLYEYADDPTQKLKYLILSAIADVRASNKEIASLEEVAAIILGNDNIERSYNYINYCMRCANEYNSRVRLPQLSSMQEQAFSAMYDRSRKQARQNDGMLVGLGIISAILLLALCYIIRQVRQLRRSRSEVHKANVELRERVQELQNTREELRRTNERLSQLYSEVKQSASHLSDDNEAKERHIANIFTICSDYINKLDDFRKNIYRMIMARRFDEISELTKSPELSQGEIKELYASFDRIFLQIYPDFVSDFNTLLRPEERIELRNPAHLTTELRIYALVRLGINDSVKIAKFLHVSAQTVYNTRQRARNKAAIPKDTFAETVKSLGKAAF
ncbi:MAG: DUF6377 domain-containing protein [Muribaculaceae bacterium]|nr:DUF6377 domain-containing protein [Muribaculaceae bacterium]